MKTDDAQVRTLTRAMIDATTRSSDSPSDRARGGRNALLELPGCTTGDALASALISAADPQDMAVYDRRAHHALTTLGLPLSNRRGRYGRYIEKVTDLRTAAATCGLAWSARQGRPRPLHPGRLTEVISAYTVACSRGAAALTSRQLAWRRRVRGGGARRSRSRASPGPTVLGRRSRCPGGYPSGSAGLGRRRCLPDRKRCTPGVTRTTALESNRPTPAASRRGQRTHFRYGQQRASDLHRAPLDSLGQHVGPGGQLYDLGQLVAGELGPAPGSWSPRSGGVGATPGVAARPGGWISSVRLRRSAGRSR